MLNKDERLALLKDDFRDLLIGDTILRYVINVALVAAVLVVLLGMYWSVTPEQFDVKQVWLEYLDEDDPRLTAANQADTDVAAVQPLTGEVTTATLMRVVDTLLGKSGGYLSNDIMPPGVYLDNVPNWEFGVLVQVRDFSRAMRESFSRSQSQSTEDVDLAKAEPRFSVDSESWMLPASEDEYRDGLGFLQAYYDRLSDTQNPRSQFYTRADNLRVWLSVVETRLGSLSQRLSASVGQRRINTDLAGDAEAAQATVAPKELDVKTPWYEIDNVFYEARGTTWALIHFLRAIEVDFADVLEKKNALISLRQIVRELEATQDGVMSPVILNGDGFGFFANHSLVMASYISRANAAIIDLRSLLSQG